MGQRVLKWKTFWCLWFIPIISTFGRSLEKNPLATEPHAYGSKLNENGTQDLIGSFEFKNSIENKQNLHNGIKIGLSQISQSLGTICFPEQVLDLNTLPQGGNAAFDSLPESLVTKRFYFLCTQTHEQGVWLHLGPYLTLDPQKIQDQKHHSRKNNEVILATSHAQNYPVASKKIRTRRSSDVIVPDVEVLGMTFEYESDKKRIEYDKHGSPRILEHMEVKMRLFGHFDNDTYFKLSKFQKCDDPNNHEKEAKVVTDKLRTTGEVVITMPHIGELHEVYLCLRSSNMVHYVRQGEIHSESGVVVKPWMVIKLYQAMLPFWLHLMLLSILLVLSGLFSGLNLGLMSLNKTDLKIIINTGTSTERKYASVIAPVRNHGNFLLCCLLFSNVLVNASLTILVDDLTSGLIAIMMSTLSIVIFGEIIPQAICSRHGLAVGAKTIYVTKFFMLITSPLAWPLSKLLDRMLGEEIGSVYTRERLKELLRVTKDYHGLETEEVGIISGALEMRTKTVKDIMVRIENVFMLPIDAVLDFDTMAEVEYHGYSRIPIYEKERTNIVALLNVKQLTLLDANDNIPLKTVIEYYQNNLFFVFENTQLNYMFKAFKEGKSGHMAFVQQVNRDGPGDPFYETIGLVTMEDVLEELLQAEIMDESDIGKLEARKSNSNTVRPKNSVPFHLIKNKPKPPVDIPPPLALAAVQFLSTSVEPFKKELLSVAILHRLVRNSAQFIKLPKHRGTQKMPDLFLYEAGKPSEYFVIILEGRVEVTVGKEKLTYESGAFTTFGKDFLINELAAERSGATSPVSLDKPDPKQKRRTFVPDYTVRIITDLHYLLLKYSAYKAAMLATGIERANSKSENKDWQDDIEKMLESGDDDTVSEVGKRARISRDESIKNSYIVVNENEGLNNKTSCIIINENDGSGDHANEETKLL